MGLSYEEPPHPTQRCVGDRERRTGIHKPGCFLYVGLGGGIDQSISVGLLRGIRVLPSRPLVGPSFFFARQHGPH